MPTIFLHVGLGKTGSSSIQAYLKSHSSTLKSEGINYPSDSSPMVSGNGHILCSALMNNDSSYFNSLTKNPISLFSREHFARELSNKEAFNCLAIKLEEYYTPETINVIAFIRNPTQHCYSLWSQKVKNAKTIMTLQNFANAYDSYSVLAKFISNAKNRKWQIHIIDYDDRKQNLLNSFFECFDNKYARNINHKHIHLNKSPSKRNLIRKWVAINLSTRLKLKFNHTSLIVKIIASFMPTPNIEMSGQRLKREILMYNGIKENYKHKKNLESN